MRKFNLLPQFKAFLLKQNVVGLAVGVVMAAAVGKLVKAFVDNLIMPVVGLMTPSGDWKSYKVGVGRLQVGIGDFVANLIDFTIVSFVIFFLIRTLIREKPATAVPTRPCPECLETIFAAARKCRHCGSSVA